MCFVYQTSFFNGFEGNQDPLCKPAALRHFCSSSRLKHKGFDAHLTTWNSNRFQSYKGILGNDCLWLKKIQTRNMTSLEYVSGKNVHSNLWRMFCRMMYDSFIQKRILCFNEGIFKLLVQNTICLYKWCLFRHRINLHVSRW